MPPDEAAAGRSVDMDAKAAGPLLTAGPWLLVSSERPLGRKRAVCSALVTSNEAASSIEPNAGDPDWSDIRGREECARPPPAAVYISLLSQKAFDFFNLKFNLKLFFGDPADRPPVLRVSFSLRRHINAHTPLSSLSHALVHPLPSSTLTPSSYSPTCLLSLRTRESRSGMSGRLSDDDSAGEEYDDAALDILGMSAEATRPRKRRRRNSSSAPSLTVAEAEDEDFFASVGLGGGGEDDDEDDGLVAKHPLDDDEEEEDEEGDDGLFGSPRLGVLEGDDGLFESGGGGGKQSGGGGDGGAASDRLLRSGGAAPEVALDAGAPRKKRARREPKPLFTHPPAPKFKVHTQLKVHQSII